MTNPDAALHKPFFSNKTIDYVLSSFKSDIFNSINNIPTSNLILTCEIILNSKISLKKIPSFTNLFPITFFSDRKNEKRILTLGKVDDINKNNFKSVSDILNYNNNIRIIYASHFEKNASKDIYWEQFPDQLFIIPRIEIASTKDKSLMKINYSSKILSDNSKIDELIKSIKTILRTSYNTDSNLKKESINCLPDKNSWIKSINHYAKNMSSNNKSKVVLARKEIHSFNKSIDSTQILEKFIGTNEESYLFYVALKPSLAFISLSPEKLFSLENNKIEVDSLAGTRPRGETLEKDNALANELQSSDKDLKEHRFVSQFIEERLKPICHKISKNKHEEILKLKNVQHLHTTYEGEINKNINIENLIETLHPTPAVGGIPLDDALSIIKEFEPFSRGLYASPMGYMSKDKSELIVGIRSALINDNTLHIFGGAGIVHASSGLEEWIETENKMSNFLKMF